MSKNTFNVSGNIISITRPEWQFSAVATVREDYLEEIQSVSWKLKKADTFTMINLVRFIPM